MRPQSRPGRVSHGQAAPRLGSHRAAWRGIAAVAPVSAAATSQGCPSGCRFAATADSDRRQRRNQQGRQRHLFIHVSRDRPGLAIVFASRQARVRGRRWTKPGAALVIARRRRRRTRLSPAFSCVKSTPPDIGQNQPVAPYPQGDTSPPTTNHPDLGERSRLTTPNGSLSSNMMVSAASATLSRAAAASFRATATS